MTHLGALTMVLIGTMNQFTFSVILNFPDDREVFLKEYASGTYGAVTYFLAKCVVELPLTLIQSTIVWMII